MSRLLLVFLFYVGSQAWICAQNPQPVNAEGIRLADPTVFYYKNKYYLYGTVEQGSAAGFQVYISDDLQDWKLSPLNGGYALRKGDAFGDRGFWAPQVFAYRKKFYMAYAANEEIAIAESDSPAGPFTQQNKVALAAPVKQIDPFVFIDHGKVYLYHVRLTNGNRIFVAEMNEDLSAIKENTLKECVSSLLLWENTANANWPVAEGPSVLKRGNLYYLFYSSNDFRNPDYAVGYATSSTPTGPWTKFVGNPVINRKLLGVNGPGHGDFFLDQKKQLNYIFHTHESQFKVGPRRTALIQFDYNQKRQASPFSVRKESFHYAVKHAKATGMAMRWDSVSLKRISPPDSAAFYARMTQLKNGDLLTVYATSGNIVATRSVDLGMHWSSPVLVASKRNEVNMDTPDLLVLQSGNILITYNSRPQGALRGNPDSSKLFDVRVCFSTDNGKTFNSEKILYEAGPSFKNGCWESSALQLPSGEIQLYFSDEAIYTASDEQNISMLKSLDNGQTWTRHPQIISFRKGSRDGMPVAIYLKEQQKVAMAIEDPGHKQFKPYILTSGQQGKWLKVIGDEDDNRNYALNTRIADSIYAGAPFLRQLATGTTLLSYQSCEGRLRNRDNDAIMQVAIGDSNAAGFEPVSPPFHTPEGRHSLWNSLCILNDDSVIAITSTDGLSGGSSEIWMIRGKLVPSNSR